jgi:hypothetical protein
LVVSITEREGHNEWGVRDYIVRGLFVINPIEIWGVIQWSEFGNIEDAIPYDLARVRRDFPGQRIYSFSDNGIIELHPRGHSVPTSHSEIYC